MFRQPTNSGPYLCVRLHDIVLSMELSESNIAVFLFYSMAVFFLSLVLTDWSSYWRMREKGKGRLKKWNLNKMADSLCGAHKWPWRCGPSSSRSSLDGKVFIPSLSFTLSCRFCYFLVCLSVNTSVAWLLGLCGRCLNDPPPQKEMEIRESDGEREWDISLQLGICLLLHMNEY